MESAIEMADQPAVIWADGDQRWCQHGQLHRDGDQPAVIRANGDKEWWHHGGRQPDPSS